MAEIGVIDGRLIVIVDVIEATKDEQRMLRNNLYLVKTRSSVCGWAPVSVSVWGRAPFFSDTFTYCHLMGLNERLIQLLGVFAAEFQQFRSR